MPDSLIEFKGLGIEYDKDQPDIYRKVAKLKVNKVDGKYILATLGELLEIKLEIEYAIRRMELTDTMRF